ncbi:MAG: hypothetical protein HY823_15810 [Acidobacteria bacterium]|nr:hypothetical protein [Acidobacteriota bacterium]
MSQDVDRPHPPEVVPGLEVPTPPAGPAAPKPRLSFTPKLIVGVFIIVAGLGLTLDNLFPSNRIASFVFRLWPAIFIAIGWTKLRAERESGSFGAYALIAAGLLGLMVTLGSGHFEDFIGPAILLAVGIWIVLKALKQHRGVPAELQASEAFQSCTAILGGCVRRPSGAFKGAELTAVFGGFQLDLRKAEIQGDSARVDVFALFGGGNIRVPDGWEVRNEVTAIAGGVDDKSAPPGVPGPKLILTGMVLFGGVEIKQG